MLDLKGQNTPTLQGAAVPLVTAVYLFPTLCKNTISIQSSLKERGQKASGLNALHLMTPYRNDFLSCKAELALRTGSG